VIRRAFWDALESCTPISVAGQALLRVGVRRAEVVAKELGDARGPANWFLGEVDRGLAAGKIGPGRDTQASAMADYFFDLLGRAIWQARRPQRDVPPPLEVAIKEYTIMRKLTGRKEPRGG
jgi:hypothetical protein